MEFHGVFSTHENSPVQISLAHRDDGCKPDKKLHGNNVEDKMKKNK